MHRKNQLIYDPIIYDPIIIETKDNSQEAAKQFRQIMRDAPKPSDHRDKTVVVAPRIEFTGKKTTFKELQALHAAKQANTEVKDAIDQKSKEYLQKVDDMHKEQLEKLKENPHQNMKSTSSFTGLSVTLFDSGSLEELINSIGNEKYDDKQQNLKANQINKLT